MLHSSGAPGAYPRLPYVWSVVVLSGLLALGCGSSGEACEDTALGDEVLDVSGAYVDRAFDGSCAETTCSRPSPGTATVRCDEYGIDAEGELTTEGDGEGPSAVEVEIYLPPDLTSPGTYSFLGDAGVDGGVWVSGGGAHVTGADEGALTNELVVDLISSTGATGSFRGEWGGELPISAAGTFSIACPAPESP